jgi:hypothetical protein
MTPKSHTIDGLAQVNKEGVANAPTDMRRAVGKNRFLSMLGTNARSRQ